jgi:hypothetical protein
MLSELSGGAGRSLFSQMEFIFQFPLQTVDNDCPEINVCKIKNFIIIKVNKILHLIIFTLLKIDKLLQAY